MKKKVIVAVSSFVFLVGLIILLSFTVFSLKSVEIDFRTSHAKITATEEEIVDAGEFKMGASVFFHGKNEYEEKIEKLSPYIKVVNIETVFPSKFVVHLVERQEVYAIAFENGHYICDEEFRILDIDLAFDSTQSNAMLLNLASPLTQKDLHIGEFLKVDNPKIYETFFENNRTLGEQTEMIKSITISSEENKTTKKHQTVATLSLFSGQTVRLVNTSYGLTYKVKLFIEVYSQLFNYIGKTLNTASGEVVLTEQHLKTCTIEINNFLHPDKGEKDCYFDIFLN